MIRIGKISHFSSSRRLIARMESRTPPPLGSKVFDSELRPVGLLLDVFGPVKSPYLSIKPEVAFPKKIIGRVIYAEKRGK
ncbi:MAG: Gar1/Naf1 family protein [Candidatus Bathyarchaeia archaeon]